MRIEHPLREERLLENLRGCRFGEDLRVLGICDDPAGLLERLHAQGAAGDGTVLLLDAAQSDALCGAILFVPSPEVEIARQAARRALREAVNGPETGAAQPGARPLRSPETGIGIRAAPGGGLILQFISSSAAATPDAPPPGARLPRLSRKEALAVAFLRSLERECGGSARNGP